MKRGREGGSKAGALSSISHTEKQKSGRGDSLPHQVRLPPRRAPRNRGTLASEGWSVLGPHARLQEAKAGPPALGPPPSRGPARVPALPARPRPRPIGRAERAWNASAAAAAAWDSRSVWAREAGQEAPPLLRSGRRRRRARPPLARARPPPVPAPPLPARVPVACARCLWAPARVAAATKTAPAPPLPIAPAPSAHSSLPRPSSFPPTDPTPPHTTLHNHAPRPVFPHPGDPGRRDGGGEGAQGAR